MAFEFLDPGPMIDRELELVAPDTAWLDALLDTCHHPLSRRRAPQNSLYTRAQIEQFLRLAPRGHQPGEILRDRVPNYHFWMRLRPEFDPPIEIAGTIGLRIGNTRDTELYYGHVGYNVYPPAQGHHYAERATRLLLPLARAHGLTRLWITCNPDNHASRRTCERLGARLIDTVPVPASHPLFQRGDREKCRYLLQL
jgi:predicted acetyltransferase